MSKIQLTQEFLEQEIFKKKIHDKLEIQICSICNHAHYKCRVCGQWNCLLPSHLTVDFIVCCSCKTPYRTATAYKRYIYGFDCHYCSEDDWEDYDEDWDEEDGCSHCGELYCSGDCIEDEDW